MSESYTRGLTILALVALFTPSVIAQVTADDFLPPVQGGPTAIKNPDKVTTKKGVISAATAQDAVNAAVQENARNLKDNPGPGTGVEMVTFPSGMGFVASGMATYREMENLTATRIAKRKAYVIAFTQAKKSLAEALGGLSNEGKETIREALSHINLPKDEMANISTQSEESLRQTVDMMLRGFVIYEVKDDTAQKAVTVSIVTTPKTRGKLARPAPNAVETNDLREGLNQVIAEVKSDIVPPIGGRIIIVRNTGETAFVGFGSAIVGINQNTAVQSKLNLTAQKIAAARAKDALCGLIVGDQSSWEGNITDSHKDEVQEYQAAGADDPLAASNAGVKRLEKTRQDFVSKVESTDVYRSVRQGVLPPGINTKTWFDSEHAWVYAMSVYVPSQTNAAAKAGREMSDAQILQAIDDGGGQTAGTTSPATQETSGFTDEQNPNVRRSNSKVTPGPTGKVGGDDGL